MMLEACHEKAPPGVLPQSKRGGGGGSGGLSASRPQQGLYQLVAGGLCTTQGEHREKGLQLLTQRGGGGGGREGRQIQYIETSDKGRSE